MPLSALLVGGAIHAPLRSRLPEFTALTGLAVTLTRDHPDLNHQRMNLRLEGCDQ